MKKSVLALLVSGLIICPVASAQDAQVEDEIVVRGTQQTDPAMTAFLSGDYATAEIEFDRNAFCALRVERNFSAGVEAARDSSIRSDLSGVADIPAQPSGGAGAGGGVTLPSAAPNAPSSNINTSGFEKRKSQRDCTDRGFQTYMKGMSQLQLGKLAEAQETLNRATKIKRTLYDAHSRLSLLAYQDGDMEKATRQLKSLRKIAKRCRRCEAKEEIESQISYLTNLLE